jgi:hypothetical protein
MPPGSARQAYVRCARRIQLASGAEAEPIEQHSQAEPGNEMYRSDKSPSPHPLLLGERILSPPPSTGGGRGSAVDVS